MSFAPIEGPRIDTEAMEAMGAKLGGFAMKAMVGLIQELPSAAGSDGVVGHAEFSALFERRLIADLQGIGLNPDLNGDGRIGIGRLTRAIADHMFSKLDVDGNGSLAASPQALKGAVLGAIRDIASGNSPIAAQSGAGMIMATMRELSEEMRHGRTALPEFDRGAPLPGIGGPVS